MADCKSCGAPLIWATHLETGNRMPLNTAIVRAGTTGSFMLLSDGRRVLCAPLETAARWFAKRKSLEPGTAEQMLRRITTAHTSHFADCPDDKQWRRRR